MKRRIIIIPESKEEEAELLSKLEKKEEALGKIEHDNEGLIRFLTGVVEQHCSIANRERCETSVYRLISEPTTTFEDFLKSINLGEEEIEKIRASAQERGIDISKSINELIF